jgi:hypothetical protein
MFYEKNDRNNYLGISLLQIIYNILFNILPTLSLYVEEITVNRRSGFKFNRSIIDLISSFCQIIQNKWEYSESTSFIYRLQDSFRMEVMYNILIQLN